MAAELTEEQQKLLLGTNLADVVTLMADGSPQVTPVWIDYADGFVMFNTAEGRVKPRNLRRDPRIALSVVDRANPFAWVAIRGRVVEIKAEGAYDHINKLSHKYTGRDYPRREGEVRLIVKIEPEHISGGSR